MAEEGEAHMGEDRSFATVQGLTSGKRPGLKQQSTRMLHIPCTLPLLHAPTQSLCTSILSLDVFFPYAS